MPTIDSEQNSKARTGANGAIKNAGVENGGASKIKGVEIAGVKIVAPEGRGGKRVKDEYGNPKFPFSNIVVESSIGLVCSSYNSQ